MSSPASAHVEEELNLPLFFFTVAASLAGLTALVWLLAPTSVWTAQISAGVVKFIAAFLVMKLFNCFVEYVFHRYVLHKPVVPFLSRFYKQHTLHHNLTRIGRKRTPGGRDVPVVENIYPMTEPEQGEASFFPWYTLIVFGLVIAPLLALLQWLAPSFPWFFAGFGAMALSLTIYEVFHSIEHWPFEKWAPLIEHKTFGWFWRKVYSFHLRHHAVIDCNEAISGFFTLPVADFVFSTWIFPKTLYVDGGEWEESEFKSPRPCRFIRWCDEKVDEIVRQRRSDAAGEKIASVTSATPARTYTRAERFVHAITHGAGLGFSVASLVMLIAFACLQGNAWHITSFAIFGATLVVAYTAFALYHRVEAGKWKQILRHCSQAAVFLLIAGTATPFLLVSMRGPWGWSLFGIVWGLCALGVLFQLVLRGRYQLLSAVPYLLVGALGVVAIKPVIAHLSPGNLALVGAGLLCYLSGIAFYFWRLPKFDLLPRHLCFVGGSLCHTLALLLFVLPPN